MGNLGDLTTFGNNILDFINGTLVPLVFAIAFLVFIWGVARYFIFSQGDEGAKEQARSLMIYGIIGFFVMVAIWGIVNLLVSAADLPNQNELRNIPDVPRNN